MRAIPFWTRVDKSGECWLWEGPVNSAGYGSAGDELAHRRSYRLENGEIPDGLVIDHLCRTKLCVRPIHLEAVTQAENLRRGVWVPKTHCPSGHEFTQANTYEWRGLRMCRACSRGGRANHRVGIRSKDREALQV